MSEDKQTDEMVMLPEPNETVAARIIDNWDGERDIVELLAFIDEAGIWISRDTNVALLIHFDDEILEWWSLKSGTGNKAA